jgi:hypothetical protein
MLSREEFERTIRVFLVELNHLCLNASVGDLRRLPRFCEMVDSCLADLRDSSHDEAQTLYTVFAVVDEYVGADWQKVAAAGYDAYLLSQQNSGPGSR